MKVKLLAIAALGLSLAAPVSALEIGAGHSKTVTKSVSKTLGVSTSVDRVNGVEVNRLRKAPNKYAKRVTHYGSLNTSRSIFGEKTRTKMVDRASFMYVGDLVTGTGNRTLKSKTVGGSLTASAGISSYSGYEINRNGSNFSKERFSGFESSFSGTTEKFSSKTATSTGYHFSE